MHGGWSRRKIRSTTAVFPICTRTYQILALRKDRQDYAAVLRSGVLHAAANPCSAPFNTFVEGNIVPIFSSVVLPLYVRHCSRGRPINYGSTGMSREGAHKGQWIRGHDEWNFGSGRYSGDEGREIQQSRAVVIAQRFQIYKFSSSSSSLGTYNPSTWNIQ
ncbi:hypothetical protein DFH09DRAFT_1112748 [Mycena vulgaris]|nr:hypothetical protein DFH09DRAFT_1112748 [Mycena vulgaris]